MSRDNLELRIGYFDDAEAFGALGDLLQETFGIDIGIIDRFGGPDPTSMPFGYFDRAGRCVANFSAFSMPLIVDGKPVRAAGYQSGAVRPDYRGLGLYRDLMRCAFDWSKAQGFDMGILLTDKPNLYTPHGFRVVEQHCFAGAVPEKTGTPPTRHLSIDNQDDLQLVQSVLAMRVPVSERFAVAGHAVEFLLNASFDPSIRLSHLPLDNAVVAWRREGNTLELLDVAAQEMPSLVSVASALDLPVENIRVFFPTDKLNWKGAAMRYHGSCELMVRGKMPTLFNLPALMLSPIADF